MPLTLSAAGGDGVLTPAIRCNISLPDTGTSIVVQGSYQATLVGSNPQGVQAVVNFSGTETSPGVPGSGTNYWIVELNVSTGVLATKTSTSAIPLPDAGNIVVFQQSIASTANAAPSQQGNLTFPWL
jgi:hypothetical protein